MPQHASNRLIIGIATDHEANPARAMLRDAYYEAVWAAGGLPLLLPPIDDEAFVHGALARLDAVVIGGGDDLHPELWSDEEVHPSCTLVTARRQAADLVIARQAVATGLPFLGICCGMQVLNIALGGGVIQDLPTTRPDSQVAHKAPSGEPYAEHDVRVVQGSALARMAGQSESIRTNSMHHQACGRLGEGLYVSGWAPDDVIEAIELPSAEFCVGVQWHPEKIQDREPQRALFRGLVEAARRAAKRQER
ncbi:MAG: gamma-glutamyl-gamma-aminobutyrate hydrolase family protein [Planctomycetota bacterium]|jgi:putative glutamine amidotransferase